MYLQGIDGAEARPSPIPVAGVHLSEEEIAVATAVLRSGNLRSGPRCAEFEEAFAARVGARFAVSVNSGTAALHVVALALLQPGDEVLVPSFTFIATASAVVLAGARPVLVDVDPETLTLDPEDARRKVTARTKAAIPVHLYGNAADVAALQQLAGEYGLKLIWDAAQAFGTRYDGRDVGSFDDAACYSFYPTKNVTTGEGGMIATNSEALYRRCQALKSHGETDRYLHTAIGLNYRLTDIAAAIGLVQLRRSQEFLARRRANATILNRELAGITGIGLPRVQERCEHSYNLYTVQVDPEALGMSRDDFAGRLRELGVGTAVHYPRPLHHQPALAACAPFSALEDSERAAERVLSLPVHPALGDDEMHAVAKRVRAAAQPGGAAR